MARLILIEDDELYLRVLEMRLKGVGHIVHALRDGRQMQTLLRTEPIDLLILDLGLPFIDGFELIAAAREKFPDLPVLAMSAQSISNIEHIAKNAGADDFLPKPFELQQFFGLVANMLANGRSGSRIAV